MSWTTPAKKAVSGLVLAVIACVIFFSAAAVGSFLTAVVVAPDAPDVTTPVPRGALNALYFCGFVLFLWGTFRMTTATWEMIGSIRRPAEPDPAPRRRASR
ncbi:MULTISPECIES: hypothetical protein [Cellulosimicrobium]|uniref:hypothetical protein n=1 Tax=Cellulosimicrobium TaxID=157920 RepID=UPI0003980955|nr:MULTISPECIES: hypothetical protein [Cellulosimicrobium]MCM3533266.1 hypothetical protein [Cellulosimicrobium funkei]